jgi:hypothetical protein
VIRTQAFFILQDPYANAFRKSWVDASSLDKFERKLGEGRRTERTPPWTGSANCSPQRPLSCRVVSCQVGAGG